MNVITYSFLFILLLLLLSSCQSKIKQVCIDGDCVQVMIADTPRERQHGLMYYKELNGGMLFIFEQPSRNTFWMKNTLIPLDIIWMDGNKNIIYIEKEAQSCMQDPCPSYGPSM